MNHSSQWLSDLEARPAVDGLVYVANYNHVGRPPEEVAIVKKAEEYQAYAVFFETERNGHPPVAQAFIYTSDGPADDPYFGELHKRLWSWGGVPLIYRKASGLIQLFRCAHKPDFIDKSGKIICNPKKTLEIAADISRADAWWDATRLHSGTIWDDSDVCKDLLSSYNAHERLIKAVGQLKEEVEAAKILQPHLCRKLLILSLLIAYLEERGVFEQRYFGQFLAGATNFFQVLADGEALITLLAALEERFNGHVFIISDDDRELLRSSDQLVQFANFIEGRTEEGGQLTFWQLYSFKDLPVEVISHIYQLFVKNAKSSIYTPPFLVRLMLEEALSWERLDRIQERDEIILDPSCGSGVFLVEAYKRLVIHWRYNNGWKKPGQGVLKKLLLRVYGIDLEDGAIELAAFSLCLALCDALEPEEIRASIKLFPELSGKTLHNSCFFEAKEQALIKKSVGVVIGNPPFESKLSTLGAERSWRHYKKNYGKLPDKQVAYLFLHEAMGMLAEGGILSMLQQYNFLYASDSLDFRQDFITKWDVREILDFISVRGLFHADTKVVVIVAESTVPEPNRSILHATFRRSGRVSAEQGFDIDCYDLHWLPRQLVLDNDAVWRSNLLGGGRVLDFINRLKRYRTLGTYADSEKWDFGEGFIEGNSGVSEPAEHIVGMPLLPSNALTLDGVDTEAITLMPNKPIERPRTAKRFTPPMLLVHEHTDLPHTLWTESYLTYKQRIVGFAAPQDHLQRLAKVSRFLSAEAKALRAYAAGTSPVLFTAKATVLSCADIYGLPYPESENLDLSQNEQILVDDMVDYYRDLIRLGEKSEAMKRHGWLALSDFNSVFTKQINAIYKSNPLQALEAQQWPGVICQPFAFNQGQVDWSGAEGLQNKLKDLLLEQQGTALHITRIARIYDGNFIFLLKPDRLRYWLRSIALRDSDEVLADLREQGF